MKLRTSLHPYYWACFLVVATSAPAAELYLQPQASILQEFDTNLDLEPTGQIANMGYKLDAATLFGITTPLSNFNILPRIRYDEYPNETSLNRLEGMVDFNSAYRTSRSTFTIFGRYDHLNEVDAELPSALYNTLAPSPTSPSTGEVNLGVTRDNAYVVPKYVFNLTRLVSIGASGTYQNLSYSVTDPYTLVDFNYEQGELFLDRSFTARTDLSLGAYATRYEATSIDSNAHSEGGSAELDYKWSQRTQAQLALQYQRTTIDQVQPTAFHGSGNTIGGTLAVVWQQETGQYRLNIGRIVTPSGGGGLYVNDQIQTEYDHSFNERLSLVGALLAVRSRGLSANVSTFDQDYGEANLSLKWMMTRTVFVQGGGSYTGLRYTGQRTGANDTAYVRFGYQGLPPQ
ncbi:MAG TPA: hypothetical protein VHY19_16545 [Steroidobacteraceae bacterium]|nr:hypothetical protein [Steroidobacteraceae bacterium]